MKRSRRSKLLKWELQREIVLDSQIYIGCTEYGQQEEGSLVDTNYIIEPGFTIYIDLGDGKEIETRVCLVPDITNEIFEKAYQAGHVTVDQEAVLDKIAEHLPDEDAGRNRNDNLS